MVAQARSVCALSHSLRFRAQCPWVAHFGFVPLSPRVQPSVTLRDKQVMWAGGVRSYVRRQRRCRDFPPFVPCHLQVLAALTRL